MERRTLRRQAASTGTPRRPARVSGWLLVGLLAGSLAQQFAWPAPCRAQQVIGDGAKDNDNLEGVFLPPDRASRLRLEAAAERVKDGRFGEAARLLGSLLESSEDYFFKPDASENVFRSLKAEAGRLIAQMPAEGREAYELQFGATARHMLTDAVAAGDIAAVAEVARRFMHTKAGNEAALLLARDHLDHDRPLAAALSLERLRETPGASERFEPLLSLTLATAWLRSGAADKAQAALVRLKRQMPQEELRIADRSVRWFNDPRDALAWFTEKAGVQRAALREVAADQWTMHRGDPAHNAASVGGQPLLNTLWRQRTAYDDPVVGKLVGQSRQGFADQDVIALPTMQPLAVGDVLLMRTTRNLLAVDFRTGKLIWSADSLADQIYEQIVNSRGSGPGGASSLQTALEQRMWEDAIFGRISSDGAQVFSVEDLPLMGSAALLGRNGPMMMNPRRIAANGVLSSQSNIRTTNRLKARELKTEGKLKWSVGGVTGDDEPKLAGAFFLGPPLPLLGRLYVLAEMKGQEIRLVALSAKTGRQEWSQQLAVVELGVAGDAFRRSAGAVPSFADGILICPTSAGAIVAVDLTTRSLLWGYQYPRNQQGIYFNPQMFNNGIGGGATDRSSGDHWVDSDAIIVDGRVLATPVEDEKLYCLNLVDGKLLWKLDRSDGVSASYLYVGCASQGNVLLVGRRHVAAVRLADGKPVWGPNELPGAATPSGHGFFSEGSYFLPLSTADIMELDLATGKVVSTARSRQGVVPGNLICYRGDVISQNVDYVEAYPQLAALKQRTQEILARAPDDPAALAQSGEVRLDEGQVGQAISLLRRSYELAPEPHTRELLAESVLAGLEKDFTQNRKAAQELAGVFETKEQRSEYLRLSAIGLEHEGQFREAFDCFLKVAEDQPALGQLEWRGDSLEVRRDRWIRQHLAGLWEAADEATRQHIQATVDGRLAAAADAPASTLESLLNVFGGLPGADALRERLAQKLTEPDRWLRREQLLLRLLRSSDPERVRRATAQLAMLMRDAQRPELAAIFYRKLAGPFAKEICWQDQTGEALVAALGPDSPVRARLAEAKPYPRGVVEAKTSSGGKAASAKMQVTFDLDLRGEPGPFFEDVNISLDRQQTVTAEDGLGVDRFRVNLNEAEVNRRNRTIGQPPYNPSLSYASVFGNQLFLWLGYQLVAIDTLRSKQAAGGAVLWSQELQSSAATLGNNMGVHPRPVNVPWGPPRYLPQSPAGKPLGSLGPASDDGVCFQRFRDLVCVDPTSGAELWLRHGLPLGCQIFGDDDVVIAAPPEGGEAVALRRSDGELLAKRDVPPVEYRMGVFGRMLLSWRPMNGVKGIIRFTDVWKDTVVWSREVELAAKGDVAAGELLGVFESGGRFTLIRLADGQLLLDHEKLHAEHSLSNIHLLAFPDALVLVTNGPSMKANNNQQQIQPAPIGRLFNPLVNGRIYGFDRSSGKRIWGPVKADQIGMMLHQPAQIPALWLARHSQGQSQQPESKTLIQAIDKRTGRKIFEDEKPVGQIPNMQITGDRNEKTVALMLPGKTITLKFTDKEPPPAPPDEAEPPKRADPFKSAAEALNKLIQDAVKPLQDAKPQENVDD